MFTAVTVSLKFSEVIRSVLIAILTHKYTVATFSE